MNTVSLVGNLATDVELKQVPQKEGEHPKKVASFLLAVGRASKEAGADFVWITAWERQAELCSEYLAKGERIAVEGRLKSRTWEQDGRRRDAIEIVARRIEFLGSPRPEEAAEEHGAEVIPFDA